MLKERIIERPCKVLRRNVKLAVAFSEDEDTGSRTPCMIEGCESYQLCGVKTEEGSQWTKCPFYGKAI